MGCLSGELYETAFNVFVLNEPDYNIMMMSNFSGLTVAEGHKEERRMVNGEVDKFKWHEVVSGHYRYRGAADNQNDLMRDGVTKPQIGL